MILESQRQCLKMVAVCMFSNPFTVFIHNRSRPGIVAKETLNCILSI